MQISLTLPKSPRLESAVFSVARQAMSTFVIGQEKVVDLSRLSLIRFSLDLMGSNIKSEIIASTQMTLLRTGSAGTHHLMKVTISEPNLESLATVEFEIIERTRGLKTSVLHNLTIPDHRLSGDISRQPWTIETFCTRFPDLQADFSQGFWPFESLFLLALSEKDVGRQPQTALNYNFYGVANSEKGCEVLSSNSLAAQSSVIEIVQGESLIAQLN